MRRLVADALAFERAEIRLAVVLVAIAAGLLSPNIYLPLGLPAVRLEQIVLVVFAIPFVRYAMRHPETRELGLIDLGFLVVAGTALVSVVVAPLLVPDVGRSWHDVFAVIRPVEYWLFYRLALTSPPSERAARGGLVVLLLVAVAAGLFALVQFVAPPGFNSVISAIWTSGHNLDGLVRARRVVGTANSANVFAMMASLFAFAGFWWILLRPTTPRREIVRIGAAMGLAILGLVLAVSRGATIAAFGGLVLGTVVVLLSRRPAQWRAAATALGASVVASIAVLVLVPPFPGGGGAPSQPATERFDFGTIDTDPSVVLRVQRLRLMFSNAKEAPGTAGLCAGGDPAPPPAGHEPAEVGGAAGGASPASPASPDARARDARRKEDVAAIAAALDRSYCRTGRWPSGDPASALAAAGLPAVPTDPSRGASYIIKLGPDGYVVAATLEDTSDPEGPVYLASNEPNLVTEPSFEDPEAAPKSWLSNSATRLEVSSDHPRFGASAGDVSLAASGYLSTFVTYTLDPSRAYSASIWLRSTSGTTEQVRFYVNAVLADGSQVAPAASVTPTLAADGSWTRASLAFRTPDEGLVYAVQLVVEPWPTLGEAAFEADGATFSGTPQAPAFALTRDVDPSLLRSSLPSLFDSPIVGLGPMNVLEIGGDPGEYALVLLRFGALGLAAYLLLFGLAAWSAFGVWRRTSGFRAILALTGLTTTAVGAVFAATTATYFNYQLMDVYWLVLGLILARGLDARVSRARG